MRKWLGDASLTTSVLFFVIRFNFNGTSELEAEGTASKIDLSVISYTAGIMKVGKFNYGGNCVIRFIT